MSGILRVARVDPQPLDGPKVYEVDPLEFVVNRIAHAAPPLSSNEIEYLVTRARDLAKDEDLPAACRERFFDNLTHTFRDGGGHARLNAFFVFSKLIDNPIAERAVAVLRDAGEWIRAEAEAAAYMETLPDLPDDPLERSVWLFQRTVANPYLPPDMELREPLVMTGPAEQRRRAEAEDLERQAAAAEDRDDRDEAVRLWEASLAAYPTASARLNFGLLLTVMQRYDEAVPLLEEQCGRYPFSALCHSAFAGALQGAGDTERALEELNTTLRLDPGRRTAALNKATLLCDLDRIDEAADVLITASAEPSWTQQEERPVSEETLVPVMKSAAYEMKQRHPERVAALGHIATDLHPSTLLAWLFRVQAAADLGDLVCADELVVAGCAATPDHAEALASFAELWRSRDEIARAIALLDLSLAERESAEVLLTRARLTVRDLDNDADAVPFYERYLALRPDDGDIWNDLGCTIQRAGDHDRAVPCFQEAVRHRPDDPLHWANLAGAVMNIASTEEDVRTVFRAIERALELDPENLSALGALAMTYLRISHFAEAEQVAQHVLERDPGNPMITLIWETARRERGA